MTEVLQLVAVEVEGLKRAEPRHLGGQLAAQAVAAQVERVEALGTLQPCPHEDS